MSRLAGKSAVVTGGARGIGEGIVRRFVAEGARCVIADIDVAAGEALAAELGDSVVFLRTDVTSEADIVAAIDACVSSFGALDVMVNNAGIVGVTGPIGETDLDAYERTMAVLLTSVFLGTKNALPVMVGQGSGSIINTASFVATMAAATSQISYTASKGGVLAMTRELGVQFARQGVRVNALSPGPVRQSQMIVGEC